MLIVPKFSLNTKQHCDVVKVLDDILKTNMEMAGKGYLWTI